MLLHKAYANKLLVVNEYVCTTQAWNTLIQKNKKIRKLLSQAVSLQNVEVPIIVKDTEILIEVKAASLDPVDLKVSLILF